MYMKTKDKSKKSGSADRRFCGLRLFHDRRGDPRTASTAVRATPKPAEQSENVHENKRRGQEPLTRLATLATLSPRGEGPLMTFVFGAQKSGEQSQNVYENKG